MITGHRNQCRAVRERRGSSAPKPAVDDCITQTYELLACFRIARGQVPVTAVRDRVGGSLRESGAGSSPGVTAYRHLLAVASEVGAAGNYVQAIAVPIHRIIY